MAIEISQLDEMQIKYKTAVDAWVNAIRHEEALASGDHTLAQVDAWEEATRGEEDLRGKAKAAKKDYEDAIREKFFNF